MIWKKLFPSEGGGALRRWIRVKKAIFEKSRDSEHLLKGPITLFDFAHRDDAADVANLHSGTKKGGWRISDDEVIGGFSRGKVTFIACTDGFQRYKRGEEPSSFFEKAPTVESSVNDDFTPFIRWNGTIDTTIGEASKVVSVNTGPYFDEHCAFSAIPFVDSPRSHVVHMQKQRSGFCAIRSPQFPFSGANLSQKYNALEITCRTDGRLYTVNLIVASYFPDDMYQVIIDHAPTHPPGSIICDKTGGSFSRIILPFLSFVLTSAGRERDVQRKLDGHIKIETIGITLMDGEDGAFEFDLARIRAVNYFDGEILGEDDEDAPY